MVIRRGIDRNPARSSVSEVLASKAELSACEEALEDYAGTT